MLTPLLLVLLPIATLATGCDPNYRVQTSQYICIYKLSYADTEGCTNPIFQTCAVKPIGSNTTVIHNIKEQSLIYCCQSSVFNMFCNYNTSPSYLVIVIISLSCFLCLFVMTVCMYRLKDEICRVCCFCFYRTSGQVINSNPGLHSQNDTEMNFDTNDKKWQMDRDFSEKHECSVCLCDEANFTLPCGHIFHRACILECFKRKYQCILCRRTELNNFKLYCKECLKRHITLYYYELKYWDKGNGETTCDNCVQAQQFTSLLS